MADEKAPEGAAASEDAYQKELAAMVKGAADEAEPKPDDKEPKEPEKKEETSEETDEADADDDPDSDGNDEEEGKEKPEKDEGKYSKAFRKLQKEEAQLQAFKATVLEERKANEKLRAELTSQERELAAFVKAIQLDPFETLFQARLLTEEQAEYISKQLYYRSKAAQADPKNREIADRLRREEAIRIEAQETKNRLARFEQEREEERRQAEQKQQLEAYSQKFESTLTTYKTKTPLLAKALEKSPARTMQELYAIANDMSAAKKSYADPIAVIFEWNKRRKELLADYGIGTSPSKPAAAPAASNKPNPPSAVEKKGPPNGKTDSSTATSATGDLDEATYWRELKKMLGHE